MSAIKKGIKKIGKFLKRYWKPILAVVAVVFTAGIAAVGMAGFTAASAAAGGGFAGTMSAIGSTMVAGTAAIGGSIGIGSGVTATTAGGAFANAPAVVGALGASGGAMGATLGTGAAAQAMGFAPQAASFAAGAPAGGIGPNAALAGGATGAGGGAASLAGRASMSAGGMGGQAAGTGYAAPQYGGLMQQAQPASGFGRFLDSRVGGMLTQGGMQMLGGYMQGRALEAQMEAQEPQALWGVQLRDTKKHRSLTPDEMRGDGEPMWSPESFQRYGAQPQGLPATGLMGRAGPSATRGYGNRALDMLRTAANPNAENPLSPFYDPLEAYVGARNGYG